MRDNERNRPRTIQAIFISLVSISLTAFLSYLLTGADEVYRGFGNALPMVSQWFPEYRVAAITLLIAACANIVMLLIAKRASNDALGHHLCSAGLWLASLSVFLFVLTMVAMYLPIFQLGSVV